eukprot:PhF_6_TR12299/c0_g1_i2/m.19533
MSTPPPPPARSNTLVVNGLPLDITAREFAVMFRFAANFVCAALNSSASTYRSGLVKFTDADSAQRVLQYLDNNLYCAGHSQNVLKVQFALQELDERLALAQAQQSIQHTQAAMSATSMMYSGGMVGVGGIPAMGMMGGVGPYGAPGMMMGRVPQMMKRPRVDDPTTVYVAGIQMTVSAETLTRLFEPFGPITRIDGPRIGKNPEKGMIAFIHYENAQSATSALQSMNGHIVEGAPLSVSART